MRIKLLGLLEIKQLLLSQMEVLALAPSSLVTKLCLVNGGEHFTLKSKLFGVKSFALFMV